MSDVPGLTRTVTESDAGRRLDKVLATWSGASRSQVHRWIAEGWVTTDGHPAQKSDTTAVGQTVEVRPVETAEPPSAPPPPVEIRYQDEHIAVINKPADLVVHDGAGVRSATLVDALLAQGVPLAEDRTAGAAGLHRPGIVHRLDRGTSGLLVVASSTAALDRLRVVFAEHDVEREYWTLVEGWPDPPTATIDAPIVRSTSNRTAFTTGDGGRASRTHYDTVAVHQSRDADPAVCSDTAELRVTLDTGRTHQVRVHLRAIGRPVAGDILYNGSTDLARELGLERQALHAHRLAFAHPVTGEPIDLTESLPEDLAAASARVRGTMPRL